MAVSRSWALTSGVDCRHAQELSAERPQIDLQRHQQALRQDCKLSDRTASLSKSLA